MNLGSEAIRNVDIELPSDVKNFRVLDSDDLPIEEIPPGKSVKLIAIRSIPDVERATSTFGVTYENVQIANSSTIKSFLDLVN